MLFVITMLLLLSNLVTAADNVRCRENERRALMEFKAGVVDEDGTLSSWKDNSNECCKWRGIRCSNSTGHVTVLNIPGELNIHDDSTSAGLSGKVSPSLSELKHLKYLNLSNNDLYGEISHQLANLTNLRYLDLQYSFGLTVENLDWVSRLQLLTHLDLSTINLNNSNDWLQQIYKLSSLTHLRLSECSLPEYDPSLLVNSSSFSVLNSLVSIDLSYNNFASPRSYNWFFNFTTTLAYVDLSLNSFENYRIPEAFGRMIFLESLVLSLCEFEGFLPDSFGNLSRLATLDLTNNNLNGSLSKFLHPLSTIEKNSLQVLDLSYNQLSGSLPDFLTRFPSLSKLSISDNRLNGSFQNNFGQLSSSLVDLDLSYNQITGPPPNLTLFSSLETLDLAFNKLEGTILESDLSNLSKLSYLGLSSNSLSLKFGFDWVPPFQLDIIQLQNCTLGPQFPNWIKSQRNFSILDISHARISDTIPLWFWDHSPRLRALNISNNQIKGILPNISLTSPDIAWIDLSYNHLQGPIPPLPENLGFVDLSHNMFSGSLSFICTSSHNRLFYLELSDNKLSGELPADCFMNSLELNTLQLANNDFSGNIPTSVGLLYQLRRLQLRNNSFTGQLPLMKNTDLQLLDSSKNQITGEIPSRIGTYLTSLIVLSLRDNEFSGSIPPEICHLQNAQVLDLSHNYLTGNIPHCINNLTSLVEIETDNRWVIQGDMYGEDTSKYVNALVQWKGVASEYERTLIYLKLIDLSRNNLVGEIPEEFASLKGLISLNLSSNNLTGYIIPDIGQMENLENLDLSRNHLSGNIPSGLANLSLLSVLDLSNNNLTGRIPSSTQLQSFDASKYAENEQLCGLPLSKKCGSVHIDKDENNEEHDDNFSKNWLYVSAVLGFGTGFWGFICPIMLRRTWRHSYYKLLGNITDWIYATTILLITRLRRKFYG